MITFPENPTEGQQWVAEDTATYTWLGDRWSTATAIQNGTVAYYVEGGDADFVFDADVDTELDGGIA